MEHLQIKSYRRKQKGLTAIVVTLGMVVLVAVGAFSVDVSHQLLNKTRLQNAVDSVALSAAIVANSEQVKVKTTEDAESDTVAALKGAYSTLVSSPGNSEIALTSAETNELSYQFSLSPDSGFSDSFPATTDNIYVRVQVDSLSLTGFFLDAFELSKSVSASAVAGPAFVQKTSDIEPIGMCEGDVPFETWGYNPGTVYEIKSGSQSEDENGLGAGNYHLLDMGSGKTAVSDALIGKNSVVITIDESTIDSETGNAVGATSSIDSRFDGATLDGVYYPRDLITTEPGDRITTDNVDEFNDEASSVQGYSYLDYLKDTNDCLADAACNDPTVAKKGRRVLHIPILDCDPASALKSGGKIEFNVVGVGCFFLSQRYDPVDENGDAIKGQGGGKRGQQSIFGEFIDDCKVVEGGVTDSDTGIERVVLYKDQSSLGGGS